MKSIEVKTAQNVVLEYELADLRDRSIAFLIDLMLLGVGILLLAILGFVGLGLSGTLGEVYSVFLACIFFFYSPIMELFNGGQSVGKMAMRIQVIKTSGGHATFMDFASRWAFRLIDIYFTLGSIAAILVASSSKAQRLGDIVADTAVIKVVPRVNLSLNDLLAIRSQESYKPVFLQAKHLNEADVLLIKTTLERYRQYRNDAHKGAIAMLAGKMRTLLSTNGNGKPDTEFLQTVLNDYVVLTR